MSTPPQLRRAHKAMSHAAALETLQRGFCGRLATIGEEGYPYCVPLLYVWLNGEVCLHNAKARGHRRASVDHEPRVCFEVDEPGEVFPYGRFECDTSVALVTGFPTDGLWEIGDIVKLIEEWEGTDD